MRRHVVSFLVATIAAVSVLKGSEGSQASVSACRKQCIFSFAAPKGWERLDNKADLPAKIEIVYLGKNKNGFTPSLNLATEQTSMQAQEYVQLAKSYHESHPEAICECIGEMKTTLGVAHLLQIDRNCSFGQMRFLQGIWVVNQKAYVMTATCLQEDFPTFSAAFFNAIKSLTIQQGKGHELNS